MSTLVKNHSGILINRPELNKLKPVLQEWINLTQRYLSHFDNRLASYCRNERASLSVLAAAAWHTGNQWVALEQVAPEQQADHNDLYLGDSRGFSLILEARQCWQSIQPQQDPLPELTQQLAAAEADAAQIPPTEASHRVAACFIAPSFPAANDAEGIAGNESLLAEWLDQLADWEQTDALAWHFPSSARHLAGSDGRYYPGTCLLLKVC